MAQIAIDTKDISGLREQILDNVRVAFPFYWRSYASTGVNLMVVVETSCVIKGYIARVLCTAQTQLQRIDNQVSFESTGGNTPTLALESLLDVSATALENLREEGRLQYHRPYITKVGRGGRMVTESPEESI